MYKGNTQHFDYILVYICGQRWDRCCLLPNYSDCCRQGKTTSRGKDVNYSWCCRKGTIDRGNYREHCTHKITTVRIYSSWRPYTYGIDRDINSESCTSNMRVEHLCTDTVDRGTSIEPYTYYITTVQSVYWCC